MSAFSRLYQAYASQFTEDMQLWRKLAEAAGAPILELGCGDGRVCRRLQQLGFPATGVDTDLDLLRRAPLSAEPPLVVAGDMRRLPLARAFRLAICPSHTLAYFNDAAFAEILTGVGRCLLPNGWAAFDLPSPIGSLAGEEELLDTFHHPDSGHPVQLSAIESERSEDGQMTVEWRMDELLPDGRVVRHQQQRVYFMRSQQELRRLLGAAGYVSIEFWGDYDGRAFAADDSTLVVVARR